MKPVWCLITTVFFVSFCIAGTPPDKKMAHVYISHFENVLGTSLELKVLTPSKTTAMGAETAVLDEISRMSKILSAYDKGSEFSKWCSTSQVPVKVSPELFEVLQLFDEWRLRSGGALDASAETIGQLWKKAAATHRIPTSEEITQALAEVKQPHWKLDAAAHTATHLSNAPLMLNSFVKSYIIKHAAAVAMAMDNMKAAVVNIGGDIVVAGNNNETIQITNPEADAENDAPIGQLLISNKAIATSGNYRRGELINGHWYSHIVDPRTGQPADNIISATVVANNATDAGALATAFNVMTPAESMQLASTVEGAEYLIITNTGERIASKGWNALTVPDKKENTIANNKGNDFELLINLEIKAQQGFAKRPYVAVWIEDENHAAVRTVTVWHGSDRYMNELKSWYLKNRNAYTTDNAFHTTVTSATRSAGKYTLKWDGKDDKGNLVKPGKYTIKIEAAREHGTYQLMRQELILDEAPKQITIPGNAEIESVSLDYRKKS
jgi:thiamine biosynthesis lipoprotein ApbE